LGGSGDIDLKVNSVITRDLSYYHSCSIQQWSQIHGLFVYQQNRCCV